jgi:putative SOS response-associated peptidase YedK
MHPVGYILASNAKIIEDSLHAEFINGFQPIFRADPDKKLYIIPQEAPDRIIHIRWGLSQKKIPGKHDHFTETYGIVKKPFYRILIRKNRCLVPANGILLQRHEKLYFLFSSNEKILTFAGIYHTWKEKESQKIHCGFSILTRQITRDTNNTFDQLPVLISENRRRRFLKDTKPLMDVLPMLSHEYNDHFKMYEVRGDLFRLESPTRSDVSPAAQKIISSRRQYNTINTKRYYY